MNIKKLTIVVNASAYGINASYNAYQFTKTALENGHQINQVFFYQDGVFQSNVLLSPASDEFNINQAWQELANSFNIPLTNCVSAALRRGMLSKQDAQENAKPQWTTKEPFIMGGLGELVTAIESSDRLIRF